jgi:small subunit ribosomal protein S8
MDTIGNLLSIIKNASMVKRDFVEVPHSNISEQICNVLKEAGFVKSYKVFKLKDSVLKGLHIDLQYSSDGRPHITSAKRISKPGRRIYRNSDELKVVRNGFGLGIVSTSRGLMSVNEAKKKHLGGEVLCEIY